MCEKTLSGNKQGGAMESEEFVVEDGVLIEYRGDLSERCGDLRHITIPSEVSSQKIVEIGDRVFRDMFLTSVDIPEGVEVIGEESFMNNCIRELNFPSSIRSIKKRAFYANDLDSLSLPEGVSTIEDGCFSENNLIKIYIPKSYDMGDGFTFYNRCF